MPTRSPRRSRRRPIAAAVSPFPSELTTPPVTKMYLAMSRPFSKPTPLRRAHPPHELSIIVRGVDATSGHLRDLDAEAEPVLEEPELLERLGELEGGRGEPEEGLERPATVGVDADV